MDMNRAKRTHQFFRDWFYAVGGFDLEHKGAYAQICWYLVQSGNALHETSAAKILNVNKRKWARLRSDLLEHGAITICPDGFISAVGLGDRFYRTGYLYIKRPIPSKLRWEVFRRDGYRCVTCGRDHDLSVDHIVPEINGGKITLENLQTLCRPCNSSKGEEEAA
jgi:hypothetical protein